MNSIVTTPTLLMTQSKKSDTHKTNVNKPVSQALIAIYCGSRMGNNPVYFQQAIELIQRIAAANLGVVYGGATIGLMGEVANTALAQGSDVVGVIPQFLLNHEIAHPNLSELHVVETMHERKAIMAHRASAFVALPGGLGTFEEILEIATWGQLDQHKKPMVLFNVNNYYQFLVQQMDHAVQEGFLSQQHRDKVVVCNSIDEVLSIITADLKIAPLAEHAI
jgi:uncharacterized protein (TIGR00730 family)